MATTPERLSKFYPHYAAGMNAAAIPPSALRPDELGLIVNGTVRDGFLTTRPGWHQVPLSFTDTVSQVAFENGVFQGMTYFISQLGKFFIVAVDGALFAIDAVSYYVIKLTSQVFSKNVEHVFFQQCSKWLVVQDGESGPIVVDGTDLRIGVVEDGVPAGSLMANGWHRLSVVSPDRTRIYFSDHAMDPKTTPISFTEADQYFANGRYFEGPSSLGKIMGMVFTPYQDTSTGIGPLVVFFEKGTCAYNVMIPRSQWLVQDITQTILPRTGSCSFFAYAERGSEIIFRDQDGRIRSLRNAQQREGTGYNMPNDFTIWNIIKDEDASLRSYSRAATFDSRTFVTVHPQRRYMPDGRYNVVHRGLAVLENTHLAMDKQDVWSFWTGVDICGMATGPVQGKESLVAFCCGLDGKNKLFQLTRDGRNDIITGANGVEEKRIEMLLSTGFIDFGIPPAAKRLTRCGVRLSNMKGQVEINANIAKDGEPPAPWLRGGKESHASCMVFDKCGLKESAPGSNPSLMLPSLPGETAFFKFSATVQIKGACTVEEMAFEADPVPLAASTNVKTKACDNPPVKTGCDFGLFSYDASTSAP